MLVRYYRELMNFCARTVKDRHAAADVVQESYARVLALQHARAPVAEPRALLYQTARNVMVDQYRRGQVRDHDDLASAIEAGMDAAPAHVQPDVQLASAQAVAAYVATIENLPPRCREAFILHVFDGLSHAQIAEQMGASVSMIEKHIARGRLACRTCQQQLHEPTP